MPPAGGTASGTFTAAGSLVDFGAAASCFRLARDGGLSGGIRLVAGNGTLDVAFEGVAAPSGPPGTLAGALQRSEGRLHVTGGTGAYATLVRGDITPTFAGRISRSHAED